MGSVYSFMSNCDIFKFDAYSQKWKTLPSPDPVYDIQAYTSKKLVKYEGRLGLACKQTDGFWEIWILRVDESWERTCILNKTDYIGGMLLETFYDSDTSVMLDHDSVIFHKFKGHGNINKVYGTSKKVTSGHPPYETFNFQSDYDLVDLKANIKMPFRCPNITHLTHLSEDTSSSESNTSTDNDLQVESSPQLQPQMFDPYSNVPRHHWDSLNLENKQLRYESRIRIRLIEQLERKLRIAKRGVLRKIWDMARENNASVPVQCGRAEVELLTMGSRT
ncbi:F-box associated domain containing protein, partial [Tanacetum coccineum]